MPALTSIPDFVSGQVLTAAQMDIVNCGVKVFASNTTRDAAYGGSGERTLEEGEVCYVIATDELQVYDGSIWVNASPLDGRNVVINGAMQIAQRGTSTASITTGGYYTVDRFQNVANTMGTWTMSVENDAPTGSGFRKSTKLLVTTADAAPAAADQCALATILEGQNLQQFLKGTSSAKSFALSFWVKSNVTGTYVVNLQDSDNIRVCSATYTVSASATWEKKTIIFPADTTGAFDNDNAGSLTLRFCLGAGSDRTSGTLNTTWAATNIANLFVGQTNVAANTNNYWQITGVQLEPGSVTSAFEFEDFGVTLAKCQRYYFRAITGGGASDTFNGSGISTSATTARIFLFHPTTMRTNASSIESATVAITDRTAYTLSATAVTLHAGTNLVTELQITNNTGATTSRPAFLCADSNANAYVGVSAEL